MKSGNTARTTPFFAEWIAAIFFFALCAAICLNVFAHARALSLEAQAIDTAVLAAENAAAAYRAADGDLREAAQRLGASIENETASLPLTDTLTLTMRRDGTLCAITVTDGGGAEVFRIDCAARKGAP